MKTDESEDLKEGDEDLGKPKISKRVGKKKNTRPRVAVALKNARKRSKRKRG